MGRFYDDTLASLARYTSGWAGYTWCYGGGYCALDAEGRFRTNKERTARPYAPAVAGTVTADAYDPAATAYRLTYTPHPAGTTELSLPPAPRGWHIDVTGQARTRTRDIPPGERATVRVHGAPRDGAPVFVVVTAGRETE
ncbi:hypothetical protein [Streptomyces sp. ISL-11]|uniref:hypothetical protein n=1 Tax=Streptomyces sp. ISL-11 TaxID=2819174 RepID=UPI001BEA62F1|nr:hypothetical protein [Streptomyces sp. ISL-11]